MTKEAEQLNGATLGLHSGQQKERRSLYRLRKYWALRLVYAQPFEDVNEAIAVEKRLKKWKRIWSNGKIPIGAI